MIPALLNAMSRRPKVSTVLATVAATWSSEETSQSRPRAWWPAAFNSCSRAESAFALTSARATAAPACANCRAVARPRPEQAPVTSATCPAKLYVGFIDISKGSSEQLTSSEVPVQADREDENQCLDHAFGVARHTKQGHAVVDRRQQERAEQGSTDGTDGHGTVLPGRLVPRIGRPDAERGDAGCQQEHGDRGHPAFREIAEVRADRPDGRGIGPHQSDASPQEQAGERDHERGHGEPRDDHALDQADQNACGQRSQDAQRYADPRDLTLGGDQS